MEPSLSLLIVGTWLARRRFAGNCAGAGAREGSCCFFLVLGTALARAAAEDAWEFGERPSMSRVYNEPGCALLSYAADSPLLNTHSALLREYERQKRLREPALHWQSRIVLGGGGCNGGAKRAAVETHSRRESCCLSAEEVRATH
jgi:hypothetical protein